MNISKPATMPDGRILVTCFGDPLPPPARGTHWAEIGYVPPKRLPNGEGVMAMPGLKWSWGVA